MGLTPIRDAAMDLRLGLSAISMVVAIILFCEYRTANLASELEATRVEMNVVEQRMGRIEKQLGRLDLGKNTAVGDQQPSALAETIAYYASLNQVEPSIEDLEAVVAPCTPQPAAPPRKRTIRAAPAACGLGKL